MLLAAILAQWQHPVASSEALDLLHLATWLGNPLGIPWNSVIILILDLLNSGIFIGI